MKNEGLIYFVIVILAFLVLGGFYFVFDKISALDTDVKNNELNLQLLSKNSVPVSPTLPPNQTPTSTQDNPQNQDNIPSANDIIIPTGIIFTVNSSPGLQPQTSVTVTIDNIAKKPDGTITVTLKAFTSQATSYSALDPASFLQYVSLDSDNQNPMNGSAIFNSMPPKSVSTGIVTFRIDPAKTTFILQTGQGDNPNFYQIDFIKGTYKETSVG
jgi:hypothetical protein